VAGSMGDGSRGLEGPGKTDVRTFGMVGLRCCTARSALEPSTLLQLSYCSAKIVNRPNVRLIKQKMKVQG
jgi:hypothetical protein